MTTFRLIWKELRERPGQLATSFLAISLGITVIVAIKTVTHFSEKAVSRELDELGANVLVLPKGVSVNDYYAADVHSDVMPESYVSRITNSTLEGVDNLSPKLTERVELGERHILLTGILPKNEFATKAVWAEGGGIFRRPEGCGTVPLPSALSFLNPGQNADKTAVRRAVVDDLGANEVLVGSEVADEHELRAGSELKLKGQSFTVKQVLPETGTVDDSRVFAHLHTVQGMFDKKGLINGIEVVGCCKSISQGVLISGLNKLLPEARVVTIKQIASTQMKTNDLMARFSLIFLVIIVIVGGAGIANYMQSNVQQRLKEIGTLMALGMAPRELLAVFLGKALLLGVSGGVVGYVLGSALAVVLGPQIAQAPVLPLAVWLGWAILISTGIAAIASALPAFRAARLDPAVALREF